MPKKFRNPMIANPRFREERASYPFIRNIETTTEKRVYTFTPQKDLEFQIIVTFPINDECCDNLIAVQGEKIPAQGLIDAVKFVRENEQRFIEAFYDSRIMPPRELVIDEESFLKL